MVGAAGTRLAVWVPTLIAQTSLRADAAQLVLQRQE
jgi:hypothetical protein